MEFLFHSEVLAQQSELRRAFAELMSRPTVVGRPEAKQWRFFRALFETTLGGRPDHPTLDRATAAQYKLEIERRLSLHDRAPGPPIDFVFVPIHRRESLRLGCEIADDYPEFLGYRLMVRNRGNEEGVSRRSLSEERALVERAVADAIDAEMAAYRLLPKVDFSPLGRCFLAGGPARDDLEHTVRRLAERGWSLSNADNPSTKRLVALRIDEIREDRATARTTEYWYLRWWSEKERRYAYPYRETNRQSYYLVRTAGRWLVEENIRPAPRTSAPHRPKPSRRGRS